MIRPSLPYPDRLRDPRVRVGTTRTIEMAGSFVDGSVGRMLTPESPFYDQGLADELDDIVERLGRGDRLPEGCYRRGIDRDEDDLLDMYGIKHLHLGGGNSDVIVFLVEYPSSILLLGIHRHTAFKGDPVGSVLRSLHDSAMRNADAQSAEATEARARSVREILAKGLLPRRPR